jgi:predicted histone-like DNA-binding protein
MAIKIERYLNRNKKSNGYGKTYGRVLHAKKVYDARRLAEHIQEHGSIYTLDVVLGVLAKVEQCIPELLRQGFKVKLDGLGTFKLSAKTSGVIRPDDFTLQANVKKLMLRFLPEQAPFSLWRSDAVTRSAEEVGMELTNYVVIGVDKETGVRTLKYLGNSTTTSDSDSGTTTGGDGGGTVSPEPVEERP